MISPAARSAQRIGQFVDCEHLNPLQRRPYLVEVRWFMILDFIELALGSMSLRSPSRWKKIVFNDLDIQV